MAWTMSEAEPGHFLLADSASHLLHRAHQLAADRFTILVGESGVTLRQFTLLAAIDEHPGLSQSDLVRATGVDRSTLAEMLIRLEKRGLVERATSKLDARAHALNLTPRAQTALVSATRHAKAADAAILDALPRNKKRAFLITLKLLAKIADKLSRREARSAAKASGEPAKRRRKHAQLR